MSKPTNIFLIRHGESRGNVDRTTYNHTPDYAIQLTQAGFWQASNAGLALSKITGDEPVYFYYSPYWRTRQTFMAIAENINVARAIEDPRIREQEWGTSLVARDPNMEEQRDNYGHFYYRMANGESCADVYDRVSDFIGSMWREFEKPNFPKHCAIVTHGMTMRVFLMRWLHYNVEQFELLANPANCGVFHLTLNADGKYQLAGEQPKLYPGTRHPFVYPNLPLLELYKTK